MNRFNLIKFSIGITAALLASGIAWAEGNSVIEKANPTQNFTVVTDDNGVISLPVKGLSGGIAKYYIYRFGNNSVRFMVLKSSDGVIRAALDACVVCFKAKRGFHQEGDLTVCNNCGNRYPSVKINVETGGCNPIPLTRTVKGGIVLLSAQELKAGASYF